MLLLLFKEFFPILIQSIFSFDLSNTDTTLLSSLRKQTRTPHLPPPQDGRPFFLLLYLKANLHKYPFGCFKLFMFSLRSHVSHKNRMSYLFISSLKVHQTSFFPRGHLCSKILSSVQTPFEY